MRRQRMGVRPPYHPFNVELRRLLFTGARARGADRLHPTMRSRMWQPGVSGNPTGRGGLYVECRRLAAEASPQAMRRLIELMHAEDERVAYMATVAVLDRSGAASLKI